MKPFGKRLSSFKLGDCRIVLKNINAARKKSGGVFIDKYSNA